MIGITILGATGSIGLNTLDVITRHPDRYFVFALTANTNVNELYTQCIKFSPQYAVMQNEVAAETLRSRLKAAAVTTEVLAGSQALEMVASHAKADYVMAAIVGAQGLMPTLAAVRAGKRVLLANKESLVMAGGLFMQEVRKHNALLLPIDSEHNAIFQCLPHNFIATNHYDEISHITLTASGGPFRDIPLAELADVTPNQACAHPVWPMGRKISVDSATMMNKGLEVIEAHWLFGMAPEKIQVVLHPQSIIHSLVEYIDGSVLAQLGNPDMRTPIACALAWPERIASGVKKLDLLTISRLDFAPLSLERYPSLPLAYSALEAGGTSTTILNAANEVAVQAFLQGRLIFSKIHQVIETVLNKLPSRAADNLEMIIEDDAKARECANVYVTSLAQDNAYSC